MLSHGDDVESDLREFLSAAAARPFAWGRHDCGLWLADWYIARTGRPDPAASLRGRYADDYECYRMFGSAAVARQVRVIALRCGARRVSDYAPGDICVARLPRGATGLIRGGRSWIGLDELGLSTIGDSEAKIVAAWRIV